MEFVRELGLRASVVEKDYVLGWLLAGISAHSALGSQWIFKGGTCLKKCYFETYRFSEDLDFTLTNQDYLDTGFLVSAFREVAEWVYERSGIEFPPETIRFDVYQNPRGGVSAEGRVGYRGPLQPGGDLPRVKLDLTADELLVLEPVPRVVHHPYSDRPEGGIQVLAYGFEELFAEKTRALAERLRPRDLYDVIHLYRREDLNPDRSLVRETLEKKCQFKGIPVPTMEQLESRPERKELEAEWGNMLSHQLPELPPFGQFWAELRDVFGWLYQVVARPTPLRPFPIAEPMDVVWRPPAMAQAWHAQAPLEIIRFAAANRLCVDLGYDGRHRPVEPYSLRRTREGNLLLHAIRHDDGQHRSYRVDRIQSAKATNVPFVPRYAIELTPAGPVAAPLSERNRAGSFGGKTDRMRYRLGTVAGQRSANGPRYVVACLVCGKRFERLNPGTRLNRHKDKNGYPCAGRTGYLVNKKY
jgi:predicted nucleotidyltransferase component of viral defense system